MTAFCALSQNKSELNNRASIEMFRECIKATSTFPNKHIAICHPRNSLWRQRNFSLKKWSRKNQSLHLHWLLQMCCCKSELAWEWESELLKSHIKVQEGKWEPRERHNYSVFLSNGWRDKMSSSCIINKLEFQYLSPCQREDLSQNNR